MKGPAIVLGILFIMILLIFLGCGPCSNPEPNSKEALGAPKYNMIQLIIKPNGYSTVVCEGITKHVWMEYGTIEYVRALPQPTARFYNNRGMTNFVLTFADREQYLKYTVVSNNGD